MRLLRALSLLICFLLGLPTALAQSSASPSCGFLGRKIDFAGGGGICVRDIPFFRHVGQISNEPNATYASKISGVNSYAIAVTANPQACPLAMFIAWNWSGNDGAEALPRCNERMAEAVRRRGLASDADCKCDVLVDSGRTALTAKAFLDRAGLLERQLSAGGAPIAPPALAQAQQEREAQDRARQDEVRKASEVALALQEAERQRLAQVAIREEEARKARETEFARQQADQQERERLSRLEEERKAQALLLEEVELERNRRQELEQRLAAAEARERERLQTQPTPLPPRPQAALRPERRVALIVGNAAYKISPLDNPVNDATDMDAGLKRAGFQTTLLRNASLAQMREATRRFADQLLTADVALIYFAGHGIESNRRNFMIPVNADLKFEYELADQAYDASNWLEMLEVVRSTNADRVNIVILDACRNNSLIGARSFSRGLGRLDAPSGTFLAYSTAPGKVAADGPRGQRNSPFTKHLLQAMQQPGLPIEEVFKEVRRNVSRETAGAQVPWESTSLTGFFAFQRQR